MRNLKNILVAVNREDDSKLVLEKVEKLARASEANVFVIRVIYENIVEYDIPGKDDLHKIKTFIMQSEEEYLEGLLDHFRSRFTSIESATLWNKRVWEGVVDAAREFEADLIVKVANVESRFQEVIHTPDDWNLLRNSPVPVMLVKADAWLDSPVIAAAINTIDQEHEELNLSILQEAAHIATVLKGDLHVVNAFPLFEPWAGELVAGYDYEKVRVEVEADIRRRVTDLAERNGIEIDLLHIREGKTSMVIKDVLEECCAEILVMGSAGRSGVAGLVVGNTSEAILHLVNTDVVTLRT
jgi:universal stress protein E